MTTDMYNQSVFLILKTAYLYYIENKSQNEIAAQLKISITTVSRLLKKAKEEKIVEFVIRDPYVECIHLEERLKQAFDLKDVVIAPAVTNDFEGEDLDENVKKLVALEGARYLQRIIKKGDVLGVTWGSTVFHLINYLNPAQKVKADFVTLHGSIAGCDSELDVRTLVTRIAKAFSGVNYSLLSEALLSNKTAADIIKQEPNVQNIIQKYDEINLAICGIGSMYPETKSVLSSPLFMTEDDLKELKSQDVRGDISLRFFDKDGNECPSSISERTIAIDFEKFKKIETKIAVVSGISKAHTVLSALKGGIVDVLILDYHLGNRILALYEEELEEN